MNRFKKISVSLMLAVLTAVSFASDVPDFSSMKDVQQKKKAFFDFMYERTLIENKAIVKERSAAKNAALASPILFSLCKKYAKDCTPMTAEKKQSLLARIDVIPPSLVLAQAANESAWGTSRFAAKANNYFGQWCFKKDCGLVPLRRSAGTTHEVRKFANAQKSVRGYLMNLNTGRAYVGLRAIRTKARRSGAVISGMDLAAGLTQYSERGEEYVKELRSMISYNKLVPKYDQRFWAAIK